jgi:tetratricopeptide (TPR) repeat protein
LYEWYFFQDLSFEWLRRYLALWGGIVLLLVVIALIYLNKDPLDRILSAYSHREFTLTQRVLTELRVVMFYISLLLWPQPSRLNLDHDFVLSRSLTDPLTTLGSLIAIVALIGLAVVTAKREPLLSYGILWFLGNLVIESSVIGLELVFEHRNYLPSMFAILAVTSLVWRHVKPIWPGIVLLAVAGVLCTVWTFERNRIWSDELALYRDCAEKSPAKARPHNNFGAVLLRRGRLAEAIDRFQSALRIKPDYADAHYNLGNALARQRNLKAAIFHFSEALRLQPNNLKAHNNAGAALVLQGRQQEAVEHFKSALEINPNDSGVHQNLAVALKNLGDLKGAVRHFSRVLEINPNDEKTRHQLEEIKQRMQQTPAGGQR